MRLSISMAVAVAAGLVSGCEDLGGGAGAGTVPFTRGYAFVDAREINIADAKDYQKAYQLTSSGNNSEPFLSADGRTVVYVHDEPGKGKGLRRVPATGGAETEIVPATPDRSVSQPAVSPDGLRVVFISERGSARALTVVNLDGSGEHGVPQSTADASPTWYPDSTYLCALTGPDSLTRNEIVRVEPSAGVRASRASGLPTLGRAVLSPDGSLVAFESSVAGKTKIFVIGESGPSGSMRQISNTDDRDYAPTWASSARIGFTSGSGGAPNVYEIDVAVGTSGSAKLTVPGAEFGAYGGR